MECEGGREGDRRIQLSQRMVDECIGGRYMMSHAITSEGRSVACCNKGFKAVAAVTVPALVLDFQLWSKQS